ncbi:unnamed protein product, partial [Meganyctiphanes norvegica]
MPLIKKPPEKFLIVSLSDYEKFEEIERTLHISDVLKYNQCSLSAKVLSSKDQSHLLGKHMRILWFGVAEPPEFHHWYGNVSFRINLHHVINHFAQKKNVYYLERLQRATSIQSRVLLTSKELEDVQPAISFDMTSLGFPIYQDPSGQLYHLKNIRGQKRQHVLEILINIDDDAEARWVFKMSRRSSVSHFMGNSGRPCVCYKYNNRETWCPSPNTKEETTFEINSWLPGYLPINTDYVGWDFTSNLSMFPLYFSYVPPTNGWSQPFLEGSGGPEETTLSNSSSFREHYPPSLLLQPQINHSTNREYSNQQVFLEPNNAFPQLSSHNSHQNHKYYNLNHSNINNGSYYPNQVFNTWESLMQWQTLNHSIELINDSKGKGKKQQIQKPTIISENSGQTIPIDENIKTVSKTKLNLESNVMDENKFVSDEDIFPSKQNKQENNENALASNGNIYVKFLQVNGNTDVGFWSDFSESNKVTIN